MNIMHRVMCMERYLSKWTFGPAEQNNIEVFTSQCRLWMSNTASATEGFQLIKQYQGTLKFCL